MPYTSRSQALPTQWNGVHHSRREYYGDTYITVPCQSMLCTWQFCKHGVDKCISLD